MKRLRAVCLWALVFIFSFSDSLVMAESSIRLSEKRGASANNDIKTVPTELVAEKLLDKIDMAAQKEKAAQRRSEKEQLEKRAEMIADQLKVIEKEIQLKISEYLLMSEEALKQKRFEDARKYVQKALRMKEAGRRIIKEKVRSMAERYAANKANYEEEEKDKKPSDYYKELERIAERIEREGPRNEEEIDLEEKNREVLNLLESIDIEEKDYEEEQKRLKIEKEKAEKRKKEMEKRAKKEKELRKQAEEIAMYIEKAQKALNNNEFDEARKYAKKAMEIKKKAQSLEMEREESSKNSDEKQKVSEEEKYLAKATEKLESKDFGRARSYAKKVLSINKNNEKAKEMILDIGEKEKAEKRAIQEKKEKEEREREERKRKEKSERYLAKALKYLERKDFSKAENYARKVLAIDIDNESAQYLIEQLPKEKEAYKEEQEKNRTEKEKQKILTKKEEEERKRIKEILRKQEEEELARKQAEVEAKRAIKQEAAMARRKEKGKNYLEQARKYFKNNNMEKARFYTWKVLEEEEGNKEAYALLDEIDRAEAVIKDEQVKSEKVKDATKKRSVSDKKESRRKETVKKYVKKAWEYLLDKKYGKARQIAYKAREISPEDSTVADVITAIDKEEMFGIQEENEEKREETIQKALKESEEKGDPFKDHDEGKSWIDHISDIFKEETAPLGDVQSGRVYTIDECTHLALARSQRLIVADKQIKLAEMRVWESRRDLLPEVTGRVERSFGKIGVGAEESRHYQGEKYSVDFKHNLFNGMGNWYALRQAQTNLDIIVLERDKVKDEVVESVKRAYYNLDKTIKAAAIQKDLKEKVNRLEKIAKGAHDEGLIPRVEYLKIKGQNMQTDFQYDSTLEDINLAKMVLFQEINVELDEEITIKPVERPKEKIAIGLENCYTLAIANRSDFQIKTKTIEYYDFERKIAKAKGWPKIELQGSVGQAVEEYQPLRDDDDDPRDLGPEWYAGIKGSVPIWGNTLEYNYVKEQWSPTVSSFRGTETATSYLSIKVLDDLAYFTNLSEARVGFENAKEEYLKAKEDMAVEVKEAYFKYKKALLQVEVAEAQVEHQTMFVKVLEERSLLGEMEASRVIEEYEKFSEHEYALIQGDADYFISLAELNKAIGIPEYFKDGYETKEYAEWKKGAKEDQGVIDKVYEISSDEVMMEDMPSEVIKQIEAEKKDDIKEEERPKIKKKSRKEQLREEKKEQARKEKERKAAQKKAKEEEARKEKERKAAQKKAKEEEEQQKQIEKANTFLDKARKQLDEKRYDRARDLAKKGLKLSLDKREARELIKNIDKEKKESEEEQKRVEQLREKERIQKEKKEKYFERAQKALNRDRFKGAREYAKKALEIDGEDAEVIELLKKINEEEKKKELDERKSEEAELEKEVRSQKSEVREKEARSQKLEARKKEEERLAKEEARNKKLEARKKKEEEKRIKEIAEKEARRQKLEAREKKEEEKRLKKLADEAETKGKQEEARRQKEEEKRLAALAEEKAYREKEEQLKKIAEEKARLKEEFNREQEEVRGQKSEARAEEEARLKEEEARLAEEEAREKEEARLAEEEAKRKQEEARLARIAKEVKRNLDKAERELKRDKFNEAREYTKKALEIDEENEEAILMLKDINESEREYIEEQARLEEEKRIEEEKARLAEEARLKKLAEEKAQKEEEARLKKLADEAEAKRKQEEARLARIAKEVKENLDKAERELREENFDEARAYVKKALEIDEGNAEAIKIMASIKRSELAYESEQKRLELVAAASRKKEEKKKLKLQKDLISGQIENKKVTKYLGLAEEALGRKRFGRARGYADKAARADGDSPAVSAMLARVNREEIQYQNEFERLQEEEKARLAAEKEALRIKAEEEERVRKELEEYNREQRRLELEETERKREEEIARRKEEKVLRKKERNKEMRMYLESARTALEENDFQQAKESASKALGLDESSREALELMDEIESAEAEYESEQKRIRLAEEKRIREQEEKAIRDEKIAEDLASAKERLEDKRFAKARAHIRDILKLDEDNSEAVAFMAEIDRTEDLYEKEQEMLLAREKDRKIRERKEKATNKKIESYLASAKSQLERGRIKRANSYIERILEIDKDNAEAEELLKEIKILEDENSL